MVLEYELLLLAVVAAAAAFVKYIYDLYFCWEVGLSVAVVVTRFIDRCLYDKQLNAEESVL